jgi:hypothetical protein
MRKPVLGLLAFSAAPLFAQPAQRWELTQPRMSVRFNVGLLRDAGLRLTGPPGRPSRDGYVDYGLGVSGHMVADAPGSIFRTVATGELRLTAAPGLAWRGGSAALLDARVAPGVEPDTFVITGTDGTPLFFADHQHHAVDRQARRLRLFNLDLRLSSWLAERAGEPRHTGLSVGVLEIEMAAGIPQGAVEIAAGGCTSPDWGAPDNDVGLIFMTQVQQVARGGGMVAISPSAVLKNVGITDVPWRGKFSFPGPPYNNDQHPYLVWNMYRLSGTEFQQIGASGLKHAFLTLNTNCGCPAGNILWVDCEDTYGVSTNNDSTTLSPRKEIVAHTGEWKRCGSIFDPNCDGVQDGVPPFNGAGDTRRLVVDEAELQAAGARYFFESWYVVRDDTNIYNGMGWREVTPVFNGTSWTFTLLTGLVPGPAIDAFVPNTTPPNPGPNADSQRITTNEGHLTLAVRATDVGGGRWRYDYALMNHDFDRRIRAFTVPLPAGAVVSNATFHDGDRDTSTSWAATVSPGGGITFAPVSGREKAPLDWGMLDNFGFEVNAAPANGIVVQLGIAEAPRGTIRVSLLGPSPQ